MNAITSLSATNPPKNDMKAIVAVAKHGKKYGWILRYASLPKVSGHRSAGRDRSPPMIGLRKNNNLRCCVGIDMIYPSVMPVHHISGIRAKASAMLVESVNYKGYKSQ